MDYAQLKRDLKAERAKDQQTAQRFQELATSALARIDRLDQMDQAMAKMLYQLDDQIARLPKA